MSSCLMAMGVPASLALAAVARDRLTTGIVYPICSPT